MGVLQKSWSSLKKNFFCHHGDHVNTWMEFLFLTSLNDMTHPCQTLFSYFCRSRVSDSIHPGQVVGQNTMGGRGLNSLGAVSHILYLKSSSDLSGLKL